MSVETSVFLESERLPRGDVWSDAVREASVPLELDRAFDPQTFSGYLPCRYENKESGFEYFFGTVSAAGVDESLIDRVGARDAVVTLVTHSDFSELYAATFAAAVLAEITDGIVYDSESGDLISGNEARSWAEAQRYGTGSPDVPFVPRTAPGGFPWLAIAAGSVAMMLGYVYMRCAA